MSTDGLVQVQPDSTGAKVDTSELTREDGTVIDRQRMVIASDENPRLQALLGGDAGNVYLLVDSKGFDEINENLREIIELLKMQGE